MRSYGSSLRRAWVPVLAAAGLLVATHAFAGSPSEARDVSGENSALTGETAKNESVTPVDWAQPQLYVVATSHLDTQWRWTIRETISEYLRATLEDNFALFEKYPDYVFSFEGAFRYALMKEYYPELYARLKDYVAQGRWRVAGSWIDAVDTNMPSPESLIRHALYGNGFFRREFGRTSRDILLPDCFGFGFALPSIAAHCGLTGFSTQKLTWGSAVGVPFQIGLWEGVDGSRVVAALNPGEYVARLSEDQSADSLWLARAQAQGESTGVHAAFRYFGTGDTGGAPTDESVAWLQRSIRGGGGPLRVRSVSADQLARDLTAELESELGVDLDAGLRPEYFHAPGGAPALDRLRRLPIYRGELLMTDHGAGCYTSQATMKRWNRKNECLADAAERAAVTAHWLGGALYPRELLRESWTRFLWHQFHDDLTGTSIPEAYVHSWNDEILSQNQFAQVLTDATGAVARALDTNVFGVPLVVYNPLSIDRNDAVDAWVDFDAVDRTRFEDANFVGGAPEAIRVYGPDGDEVVSQMLESRGTGVRVVFVPDVPSLGFAVYDVRPASAACAIESGLRVSPSSLENKRYRVHIDPRSGDIIAVQDLEIGCDLLRGPLSLQLLADSPHDWAAWEVDFDDIMAPPRAVVSGPAQVRVVENGPARVALEVARERDGSTFTQRISLAAEGDRVDIELDLDWRTRGTLLKAAFPLAVDSARATYDLGLGTVERGINHPELYEVPAQRWADLCQGGEALRTWGVAVLNDSRYGWDRPEESTLRLSLVRTPEVNDRWGWIEDQASQDLGRHLVRTALYGHTGDWRQGGVQWAADRLNQPPIAFQANRHPGALGRSLSLLRVETLESSDSKALPAVAVRAVKLAEESDEFVIRLQELHGVDSHVRVVFPSLVQDLREVNGAETPIDVWTAADQDAKGPSGRRPSSGWRPSIDGGGIRVRLAPYQPRAFAFRLAEAPVRLTPPASCRVDLPFDVVGITTDADRATGDFDGAGHSLASEMLPPVIVRDGVLLHTGPRAPGEPNVLSCRGQSIALPQAGFDRLYVLIASIDGDRDVEFTFVDDREGADGGTRRVRVWAPDYSAPIAQWDSRVLDRELIRDPQEIMTGFVKDVPVGWVGTHRHSANGGNEPYQLTTLFLQRIDFDPSAREVRLPNDDRLRIVAISAVRSENASVQSAQSLVDAGRASAVLIDPPTRIFIGSVAVELRSPNRGAILHYTLDGSDPDKSAPIYTGPLTISQTTQVKARAFAPGFDVQPLATAGFRRLEPRSAAHVSGARPGLRCRYYEGSWNQLPDFGALTPARTTVEQEVGIPEPARREQFGLVLEGYLRAPVDGLYTLHIWSDDGSAVWLGNERLIDNDGLHGSQEKWAHVALRAGLHPLRVDYFQRLGGRALELWVEGPGAELQKAPAEWLLHSEK